MQKGPLLLYFEYIMYTCVRLEYMSLISEKLKVKIIIDNFYIVLISGLQKLTVLYNILWHFLH